MCDGHGKFGKEISESVSNKMTMKMTEEAFDLTSGKVTNRDSFRDAIVRVFKDTDQKLRGLQAKYSGSTCISLLCAGRLLICGNCGDSRAILVKSKDNTSVSQVIALSRDHKPNDEREALRIRSAGGKIDTMKTPENKRIGPLRVWHRYRD